LNRIQTHNLIEFLTYILKYNATSIHSGFKRFFGSFIFYIISLFREHYELFFREHFELI